jgi:lipopolysaccharide/colanic/teichoic acid biosynthesis glycosyltransferase
MDLTKKSREDLILQIEGYAKPSAINIRKHIKIFLWRFTIKFSYFLKRLFDVLYTGFFLIVLSPLYLLTMLIIYLEDGGNPIFYQKRVGLNGRHFNMYKFRTMVVNAEQLKKELMDKNESNDGVIFKMKDDPRITRIGKFLRKTSIDEMPQLFNVFIGDMSLVGPRPPLVEEVANYTLEDRKRLHAIPGITGQWQISGRSHTGFKRQVELDKEYIKSQSFLRDIIILFKTVPVVIFGDGAY